MILTNPFAEFHIAKNIRERQYLSEEELHRLMIRHFDHPLQNYTRDIFVFAALTGMSFVDISALRKSDIYEIDGYQWIITSRHKTGIPFKVRLLPQALTILERYADPLKERIFDLLGYHAIAKRLRQVMKENGITRPVTFHCARHTFAIMALNQGMPIESVSSILGHSNIRTTQIYAKITIKKLDSDFAKLENELSRTLPKKRQKRFCDLFKKIFSLLVDHCFSCKNT
jgi:integrase